MIPRRSSACSVRGANGNMVPLGAVLKVREQPGPILVYRYNMYPAAAVVGGTRPGFSTGEGIEAMERLADASLPESMGYEWTEINFIQIDASKNVWNNLIFPLAVVFVFLVLAAQYESWALPLAVILVVPMCILGSLTGVFVTHTDINIFTQIGFVVLVGLASKNAILIVEFAKRQREDGTVAARRYPGGVSAATAADLDDIVRLHPGCGSAVDRIRRRGRDAQIARHSGL